MSTNMLLLFKATNFWSACYVAIDNGNTYIAKLLSKSIMGRIVSLKIPMLMS